MASNPRSIVLALCLLMVFANGNVYVWGAVTGQTNENDVRGLEVLILRYNHLYELVDDPCYPVMLTWIKCSNDASPRVTALYLGNKFLSGTLPDFSSMDALERIYLNDNLLIGSVPEFLGTFPKLKELNLANNYFSGPIPSSLAQNKNLKADFSGNYGLYIPSSPSARTSPSSGGTPEYSVSGSSKKKSKKLPIILGTTISVFVVLWAAVGVFFFMRQRERTEAAVKAAAAQSNATSTTNTPVEERPINQQH